MNHETAMRISAVPIGINKSEVCPFHRPPDLWKRSPDASTPLKPVSVEKSTTPCRQGQGTGISSKSPSNPVPAEVGVKPDRYMRPVQGKGFLRRLPHPSTFRKGQVTVELILLGVVLIILSQLVINQIKTNKYVEDFAKGPSQVVANMIANGNWKKSSDESKSEHPNIHERHYSWDP